MEDKRNNQASVPASDELAEHLRDYTRIVELPKIVLASASPRRAAILRTGGWPFETLPLDIDERLTAGEDAVTYVQRLARAKAEAAALRCPDLIIVAADTVVLIEEQILGKPRDDEDARGMLRNLSGRWPQVLPGAAFIEGGP